MNFKIIFKKCREISISVWNYGDEFIWTYHQPPKKLSWGIESESNNLLIAQSSGTPTQKWNIS